MLGKNLRGMSMYKLILNVSVLLSLSILSGCTNYKEGQCFQMVREISYNNAYKVITVGKYGVEALRQDGRLTIFSFREMNDETEHIDCFYIFQNVKAQ